MKKEIFCMLFVTLVIASTVFPVVGTMNVDTSNDKINQTAIFNSKTNKKVIFTEIDRTADKVLMVDDIIGDRQVKYWEHIIDDVYVKGDYILLHIDIETDEIVEYIRDWTDVKLIPEMNSELFKPEKDYFWKNAVVFPDENDCTYFYTFDDSIEYPLTCWEVRYKDGTTIMYEINGMEIGYGEPAPSKGFSLSGFDSGAIDPWKAKRENADHWFKKWCSSTTSISLPTPSTISSYVSNSQYDYFYELAHGGSTKFQADSTGSYYTSSDVASDMAGRSAMTFAFIGSCEGMTNTGPGTFSYEFRKGSSTNTVTVGYTGMGSSTGWGYSSPWQDYMFQKMYNGETMRKAFDLACSFYPLIAPNVVFEGDTSLKIPTTLDVWIKDCPYDDGTIPSTSNCWSYWDSEDIWIDNDDDGIMDTPIEGGLNHLYAKVRNRGNQDAKKVDVDFYYRSCSTGLIFPDGATFIGTTQINKINAGLSEDCWVPWTIPPPPTTGHWCIGVIAKESNDDQTSTHPPDDNNLAICNIYNFYNRAGGLAPYSFCMENPYEEAMMFFLDCEMELPDGWEYTLNPPVGSDFLLAAKDYISALLRVFPSEDAEHGETGIFSIWQCESETQQIVGGVTVSFIIDEPPEKPIIEGPTEGKIGVTYTYETFTDDTDGDQIRYYFDWGDGSLSLTDPIQAGEMISESHSWTEKGNYSIRVKAIDELGAQSPWSDPLVVTMPKNKLLYRFPILLNFLERHPRLFSLLKQLLRV